MTNKQASFAKRYLEVSRSKNSILCVGLDPAVPEQRKENVLANNDRLAFMKQIIKEVSPFASVIKINRQYIIGLTNEQIADLNKLIHRNGMLSIIDHKLSDIGSTNASAIYWIKKEGFDAFTFSPFAGNIGEATKEAHKNDLGIIVLTLMSNPESSIQKETKIGNKSLYIYIAEECRRNNSDACVVGATGNVTTIDLLNIKKVVGENILLLVPGVGAQGGDAENIIQVFGKNLMINVGRSIIYSDNPGEIAENFQRQFNKLYSNIM